MWNAVVWQLHSTRPAGTPAQSRTTAVRSTATQPATASCTMVPPNARMGRRLWPRLVGKRQDFQFGGEVVAGRRLPLLLPVRRPEQPWQVEGVAQGCGAAPAEGGGGG